MRALFLIYKTLSFVICSIVMFFSCKVEKIPTTDSTTQVSTTDSADRVKKDTPSNTLLQPRISTYDGDPRILLLLGTWYNITASNETFLSQYTKDKVDTARWAMRIDKQGMYTRIDQTTNEQVKGKWILFNKKIYMQAVSPTHATYAVFSIDSLASTQLVISYKGLKNIFEPFLCGKEEVFYITEEPARFGTTPQAFTNYFSTNLNLSQQAINTDADCIIDFFINCSGEICDPQVFFRSDSEFEKAILSLVKQMPKWSPALHRGVPVNVKKRYKFTLSSGVLRIIADRP